MLRTPSRPQSLRQLALFIFALFVVPWRPPCRRRGGQYIDCVTVNWQSLWNCHWQVVTGSLSLGACHLRAVTGSLLLGAGLSLVGSVDDFERGDEFGVVDLAVAVVVEDGEEGLDLVGGKAGRLQLAERLHAQHELLEAEGARAVSVEEAEHALELRLAAVERGHRLLYHRHLPVVCLRGAVLEHEGALELLVADSAAVVRVHVRGQHVRLVLAVVQAEHRAQGVAELRESDRPRIGQRTEGSLQPPLARHALRQLRQLVRDASNLTRNELRVRRRLQLHHARPESLRELVVV
mmetsp:Transcript_15000/g.58737  ORF Transcript_15000/g.58737 Transcript_15000/m.58737 type:complete len:293 (-) Transcript_15000:1714-2592(-)